MFPASVSSLKPWIQSGTVRRTRHANENVKLRPRLCLGDEDGDVPEAAGRCGGAGGALRARCRDGRRSANATGGVTVACFGWRNGHGTAIGMTGS